MYFEIVIGRSRNFRRKITFFNSLFFKESLMLGNFINPMEQLFQEIQNSFYSNSLLRKNVSVNVYETSDQFLVTAKLPGIDKKEVNIELENQTLKIQANREIAYTEEKKVLQRERRNFNFQESIELPAQVNAELIEANYENGILSIVLPKAETAKSKQITIH